jgi:TPR repeat protein
MQLRDAISDRLANLRHAIEKGDGDASFELGCLFDDGETDEAGGHVIRPNAKRAVAAYRRAIELGRAEALLNLGYCYAKGRGVRRSQERELRCYTELWRLRRDWAAAANAACVCRDRGNLRAAFAWWAKAAAAGGGDELVNVGYCRYYGIGVRQDRAQAMAMFRRACRTADITVFGRDEARYHLAVAYLDRGRPADRQRARALLARANRDNDYPEAGALLEQLKTGGDIRPCRCVRGLARKANGQAPCAPHRRARDRR